MCEVYIACKLYFAFLGQSQECVDSTWPLYRNILGVENFNYGYRSLVQK